MLGSVAVWIFLSFGLFSLWVFLFSTQTNNKHQRTQIFFQHAIRQKKRENITHDLCKILFRIFMHTDHKFLRLSAPTTVVNNSDKYVEMPTTNTNADLWIYYLFNYILNFYVIMNVFVILLI